MNNSAYSCRVLLLFILFFYCIFISNAQVYWDGEGGDGLWSTATNWVGNILPSITDDVVLNNAVVANSYIVNLPAGNNAVSVKSLTITPSTGNTIEVVLPNTNTLTSPAFTAAGPGYGLVINERGIFRNASGATGGNTIAVSDSIRINNGGKYIHNTARSHALVVTILSRLTGTEAGIFEFDVPGTAGFVPSFPGRIYGTVMLSATAAGGSRVYTSIGVQPVMVRGDLVIGSGVNYSISFRGGITIKGNLIQHGGIFNIASDDESTVILLGRDLIQHAGTITETAAQFPVIRFNGTVNQDMYTAGSITNDVTIAINNTSGVTLQSALSLPYKLKLENGKVTTTSAKLLTLQTNCILEADSLASNTFINGPLRKEGLISSGHFLFPVGKGDAQRWLALKNATGNFMVEFHKGNPRAISSNYAAGIDHISGIEYWSINADASPAPSANVELSFVDPNSGGVTDINSLRVAQFTGVNWSNNGNTGITGTAGSRGSVTSNATTLFGPSARYFTLASSDAGNPLPSTFLRCNVRKQNNYSFLSWEITRDTKADYFEILASHDNRTYTVAGRVYAAANRQQYSFVHKPINASTFFYKISVVEKDGTKVYSQILTTTYYLKRLQLLSIVNPSNTGHFMISIISAEECAAHILVTDMQGRLVKVIPFSFQAGMQRFPVDLTTLPDGLYTVQVVTGNEKVPPVCIQKL